ncbi:uncharacterized protein LOC116340933 [Contarinia nasturtii]|uniref:uncharacterized protein LOC116340933 n=1 Tax=Contarinia nasturtii TaxID=265458 RepID=UPI0012D4208B|nr:uncharacterized protein LOC116340933 [Contarinia nasturtii]
MSVQLTNTTFELRITPNKRKRDDIKERKQYNHGSSNKENHFVYNNFLEVKSIAELVESKNVSNSSGANVCNPFEIVRKPPKKKNRKEFLDDGCFVNPALNLNGPEHVVNPFEVRRAAPLPEAVHHCYENTGLNIRGEERQVINPFEIVRECTTASNATVLESANGIENPGLDIHQAPLAISVPFTPTVGCRIDFKNIPIEDLTPSSMMNRHLVFSPVKTNETTTTTPKRKNLSVISEEAVDISKELDCYQLELENSMNEAKATNKRGKKNLMDIKQKSTFAKRLSSAAISTGNDIDVQLKPTEEVATPKIEEHSCCDSSNGHNECPKSSTPKTPNENCIAKYSLDKSMSINENPDVVYEEVNETHHIELDIENETEEENTDQLNNVREEEDAELFKNPAPFVRAYRRDLRKRPTTIINEPRTVANNEHDDQIKIDENKKEINEVFSGIRSSIRKSIRKLIHPNSSNKSKNIDEVTPTKEPQFSNPSSNLLTTIRHSLRRKQPKQPLATSTPRQSLNDISIIDTEPRAIYKDTVFSARINNPIDENLLRPRTNLRNSLRRSKHAVKNVFKKNTEDYEFRK